MRKTQLEKLHNLCEKLIKSTGPMKIMSVDVAINIALKHGLFASAEFQNAPKVAVDNITLVKPGT